MVVATLTQFLRSKGFLVPVASATPPKTAGTPRYAVDPDNVTPMG